MDKFIWDFSSMVVTIDDGQSVAVTGVSLPATATVTAGGNPVGLTAIVEPTTATDKTVVWASSDTSVATVENGVVTAVAVGTATITATATNGTEDTADDKPATCAVTVYPPLTITSVSTAKENGSITSTASASGGAGALSYRFYLYKDGEFVRRNTFGSANTFRFKPTEAGVYRVKVFVQDEAGTTVGQFSQNITVSASLKIASVTADAAQAATGDTVTVTANASNGEGALSYRFYLFKDGEFVRRNKFGSANTFSFKAAEEGVYRVKVFVMDEAGTTVSKYSQNITVSEPK